MKREFYIGEKPSRKSRDIRSRALVIPPSGGIGSRKEVSS
jgi:hypothetical protein